jgi:hypothetical protein
MTMAKIRPAGRRAVATAAATLGLIAGHGCTGANSPPAPASPSAAVATTGSPAPLDALVGAWSRTLPQSEVAYRFLADGRYRSVAIIGYAVPGDSFEMQLVQDGVVEIDGNRIRLVAKKAATSRKSTKDPAGDYTNRQTAPKPEEYVWSIAGEVLSLTADDGTVVMLTRQP